MESTFSGYNRDLQQSGEAVLVTPFPMSWKGLVPMNPKDTSSDIPYGYCHCGCGQKTTISPQSVTSRGYVKGEPRRYIAGHNASGMPPKPCTDILLVPKEGIAVVPLTSHTESGLQAIIDIEDAGKVQGYRWHASRSKQRYYASYRPAQGKYIRLHNLILPPPDGTVVDHIDCDSLNNRKSNLRIASPSQNQANQRLSRVNTTGYKGISAGKDNRWWVARIKRTYVGCYRSPEEAARAYDDAARKIYGEFARLNFPREGEQQA